MILSKVFGIIIAKRTPRLDPSIPPLYLEQKTSL